MSYTRFEMINNKNYYIIKQDQTRHQINLKDAKVSLFLLDHSHVNLL